ncbi:MAG TPA: hypothetical protein VGA77_14130 [Propylenella sp.]
MLVARKNVPNAATDSICARKTWVIIPIAEPPIRPSIAIDSPDKIDLKGTLQRTGNKNASAVSRAEKKLDYTNHQPCARTGASDFDVVT